MSSWQSEFCIGVGNTCQSYGPRTSAHEPAPLNLSPNQRRICAQKTYFGPGYDERLAEQSQVGIVETSLPFSMPPSDKMLSRIAILLFIVEHNADRDSRF
jgi:hypothetical protein